MEDDVAPALTSLLNRLMLPANRGALCAPVIAVAPDGVDTQTYPVLNTLATVGPVTVARLAEQVGIDRSGTSRYADRLQEAGLIKRTTDPLDRRATLLFSAKEAFYKCQYPVTGQWLDFQDIAVVFAEDTSRKGGFTIRPSRPLELENGYAAPWRGRFALVADFVVAGIALLEADFG